MKTEISLETMRHSASHLMAAAIQSLWPAARFGVGPAIENGFYYDVLLPESIGEEQLAEIEKRMRKLRKQRLRFEREDLAIDEAIQRMRELDQPYKVELLGLLKEKGATSVARETGDECLVDETAPGGPAGVDRVSMYRTGEFIDLCRGPHVEHAGQIGAFKLHRLAGAYWRGQEQNDQLQRVYGLCYATQEELDAELARLEQVRLRDHRRIGKALHLFAFSDDVGSGLPLWLPNGVVLQDELAHLALQEERRDGYQRVVTPHITRENLYYRSGHLPFYQEDMYRPMDIDGEKFYLRPMNCPHHHQIYLAEPRSYRQLPLRLSEYGQVYRYEKSGSLSGLMRTRGFCQNDAHLYCRFDQAKQEFVKVMHLHARYYELMKIENYYMVLALPDLTKLDKYIDEPDKWLAALTIIREAMVESGYPFVEREGEAAFYGPKVDFMIKSVVGTEYAISTNQLDFLATERFGLTYRGADDQEHPVYVIHRAPLGSHERFTAFLIEHYAGAFPTWLAPVQVRVIPIADRHEAYAEEVRRALFEADVPTGTGGLRVDVDLGSERMQKKVRNAQLEKIPYMLVLGDREQEQRQVAVRLRSGTDLGDMPLDQLIARLRREVEQRADLPE